MNTRTKKIIVIFLSFIIFCNVFYFVPIKTNASSLFFTLIGKTYNGGCGPFHVNGEGADYFNLLKQHLAKIGIKLEVIVQDWPTFYGDIVVFKNFDICYITIPSDLQETDCSPFIELYTGSTCQSNLFGYDEAMDWDPTLEFGGRVGWGKNFWYLRKGISIMPPDSEERICHYWAWEQHLMDNILPCQPLITPKTFIALWENLNGFNFTSGILQSWGKISFEGIHFGQKNANELVIADVAWSNLNPLFQDDSSSSFISDVILDPLIWYDADLSVWPHLAKSYNMINDTHVRIETREGIKWQDPGEFPNEFFDAQDVYFTLYAWKHVSKDVQLFHWIEKMQLIDDKTLDIFIDGDSSTPENELYVNFLETLSINILPEHYLNQTQTDDGITPDLTHKSWFNFATHCFGTGLFCLSNFTEGIETTLSVYDNCWMLDSAITNDSVLDFERRFGDFSNSPKQLRIRIIPEIYMAIVEFEHGRIDIVNVSEHPDKKDQFNCDLTKEIQSDYYLSINMFGYNLREIRPVIGNRNPCSGNSTITKGLAIRKAISYAMNREAMNNIIHGGKYTIIDFPIPLKLGIWCNPNIIRYDHNLEKAKEYMTLAGYGSIEPTLTNPNIRLVISFLTIFLLDIVIKLVTKVKKNK